MRKLIFAINTTLDGCCDHTKQMADEETHRYFTHLMREVDLLVFGRKTYQLMVPFWPEVAKNQSMTRASNEFAKTFDSSNKIVFGPIVVGEGRRLLEGVSLPERLQIKLVESKIFESTGRTGVASGTNAVRGRCVHEHHGLR